MKKIVTILTIAMLAHAGDVFAGNGIVRICDGKASVDFVDYSTLNNCNLQNQTNSPGETEHSFTPLNAGFNYRHLFNVLKRPYYA